MRLRLSLLSLIAATGLVVARPVHAQRMVFRDSDSRRYEMLDRAERARELATERAGRLREQQADRAARAREQQAERATRLAEARVEARSRTTLRLTDDRAWERQERLRESRIRQERMREDLRVRARERTDGVRELRPPAYRIRW